MKIWSTKYCLTTGIVAHEINDISAQSDYVYVDVEPGFLPIYLNKGDWHKTPEEAIERAEEMRIKKLKSLDKQVKKISAIVFEVKE